MKVNDLVVGSGLFGAVYAREALDSGRSVAVIDKRDHIGGNVYTKKISDIDVHVYGAHIFHTSNREVWEYVNRFAEFNNYINSPIAIYGDELYNLPFNMNTFSKMWGIKTFLDTIADSFPRPTARGAERILNPDGTIENLGETHGKTVKHAN